MTDARLPSRWLYAPEIDGLSDRAWRVFTNSLMWSNEQGTDGDLPTLSLRHLHPQGVDDASIQELIDAGKWEKTDKGFQVLNWQKSQSLAAAVEYQRDRNRKNVKASRKRRSESPDDTPTDDSGDVSGDNIDYETGELIGVHVGQDRQGQDALRSELAGTSKRQTKMAVVPGLSLMSSCSECQRRSAFNSGPCPLHRSAIDF